MNSDKLNHWLTLGANIGVLAGIVFLALEIRQNSDLARLQFAEDRQALWQEGEIAVFGDKIAVVWAKSIQDPASLTLAETRALDAYLAFQLTNASRVFQLEKAGLLESGYTKSYVEGNLPFFFDTQFAKVWWEIEGRGWGDEFVQIAEPVIAGTPLNQTVNKLIEIREETDNRVRNQN